MFLFPLHGELCHEPKSNSSVCVAVLEVGEKGSLPVVATVFDKLNQVYKDYLEAEQSYTQVRHPRSFLLPKVTRSDL